MFFKQEQNEIQQLARLNRELIADGFPPLKLLFQLPYDYDKRMYEERAAFEAKQKAAAWARLKELAAAKKAEEAKRPAEEVRAERRLRRIAAKIRRAA